MVGMIPVTSFIKEQRIQWLGYIMRRGAGDYVRIAIEWRPHEKKLRVRPRKR